MTKRLALLAACILLAAALLPGAPARAFERDDFLREMRDIMKGGILEVFNTMYGAHETRGPLSEENTAIFRDKMGGNWVISADLERVMLITEDELVSWLHRSDFVDTMTRLAVAYPLLEYYAKNAGAEGLNLLLVGDGQNRLMVDSASHADFTTRLGEALGMDLMALAEELKANTFDKKE